MNTLDDRLPLIKLTPFGAVWSVIEAEGHTVVSKTADGKTVLTGTSPYDGIETSVTVEDSRQHPKLGPYDPTELIRLPVAVTVKANGHTYGATFADYRGDLEPNVWMIFPTTIKWTLDGKPLADLKVTFFRSNPYIVFPIPDVVKAAPADAAVTSAAAARGAANRQSAAAQRADVLHAAGEARLAAGRLRDAADADRRDAARCGRPSRPQSATGPGISGTCLLVPGLRRPGGFEADQSAMQRGAQWNKPLYKPEYWEKVRSLDYGKVEVDPFYGCYKPLGVPRQNVPGRIVQKDKQIWLFNNVENGLRILPLDDRKRDENDYQFSTSNGMGLARWDGDTLVIESVGFNGVSWLGWEGYFHTDKMEVTERFTRNGDLLYYNFTVNDPDVLMEPWTSYTYVRRLNPNPDAAG